LNGLRIGALTRVAQATRRLGDLERAARFSEEACDLLRVFDCTNFYRAETWWTHADLLRTLDPSAATDHLHRVARWVLETARDAVAPEYRTGFLETNVVNRAVLEAARATGLSLEG
jgi:hypothetical protein